MEIFYPDEDLIIEFNALGITTFDTKKADKVQVLSRNKISYAINTCREKEGKIYRKAAVLLIALVKGHAFASGNIRTAFLVTKHFLESNKAKIDVKDDPENANTLRGIRESYYTEEEIERWLENGKIRKFKRF